MTCDPNALKVHHICGKRQVTELAWEKREANILLTKQ